jgi:hypothetical protein
MQSILMLDLLCFTLSLREVRDRGYWEGVYIGESRTR